MTPTQKAHRQGTFYMLLVIAIWGGFLPVGKSALQAIDPYWLTALRFGTAALVFLGLLAWREGRDKLGTEGHPWKILFFGACGFAGFGICLFEGLRLTRPEISAMILATGPIQFALVQWWRSKRRPDNFTLAMIVLAVLGELLVVTSGQLARLVGGDALGNGLVFLASLFWTAYTLGGQEFPEWSPVRYTALSCSLGSLGILLALIAATAAGHSRPPTAAELASVWPQLIFIVFCVSVFGILFFQHVRVDHRGAHVRVPEQLLHRADVVAGFQQMGRERVAQRVRRRRFGHPGRPHGQLECALHRLIGHMLPAYHARARVDRKLHRGKNILPGPFPSGIRILAIERIGQPDLAMPGRQVLAVEFGDADHVIAQGWHHAGRQHRHPILEALAVAHENLATLEIDILHPQAQAFHDAQTSAIHQPTDQGIGAFQPRKQRGNLGLRQHHRQAARGLGRLDIIEPRQLDTQHLTIEKKQCALGPDSASRRPTCPATARCVRNSLTSAAPRSPRMTLAKMPDKSFNPIQIRLFGAHAVVQKPNPAADLFKQTGCRTRIR
jgi:drug/metabolite transporter (DMT)-like permease